MVRTLRGSMLAMAVCGLALSLSGTPAWAQKGGSGGGGGGGGAVAVGGGGGGGGVKVTTTTVPVTLFGSYYGIGGSGSTVAKGSASLTFDASQTSRSFTVSVSNVNLPDGMIMHVDFLDDGLTEPGVYYPVWVTQPAGEEFLSLGASHDHTEYRQRRQRSSLRFGRIDHRQRDRPDHRLQLRHRGQWFVQPDRDQGWRWRRRWRRREPLIGPEGLVRKAVIEPRSGAGVEDGQPRTFLQSIIVTELPPAIPFLSPSMSRPKLSCNPPGAEPLIRSWRGFVSAKGFLRMRTTTWCRESYIALLRRMMPAFLAVNDPFLPGVASR